MRAAVEIARKDLRQRMRDRSAYVFGIVAPLGLAIIFSLVLGGVDDGSLPSRFGVADADGGPVGDGFVELLEGLDEDGVVELERLADADALHRAVEGGDVDAGFALPAGMSQAVTSGGSAEIEVVTDADATVAAQVARSIAGRFATEVSGTALAVTLRILRAGGRQPTQQEAAALASQVQQVPPPVQLGAATTSSKQLDLTSGLAAGMAVFFLFFTVQFGVISMLEEREAGTLARLRVAPVPGWSILVGKAMTSFVLGVVSMTVVLGVSSLALGAQWGDPVGVAMVVVAGVVAAVSMMALVARFAHTAEQAGMWGSIIGVVLGLAGGAFFPVSQGPQILDTLSRVSPHNWFLRALGVLSGGGGPADILGHTAAILAFAAGSAVVALIPAPRRRSQ